MALKEKLNEKLKALGDKLLVLGGELGADRPADPSSTSIFFVGAIGCAIFVVLVCFATGLFQGMEREAGARTGIDVSPLLQTTVVEPRARLEGWSKRLDEETDTEHLTLPIQQAMRLVQGELQSGQGR